MGGQAFALFSVLLGIKLLIEGVDSVRNSHVHDEVHGCGIEFIVNRVARSSFRFACVVLCDISSVACLFSVVLGVVVVGLVCVGNIRTITLSNRPCLCIGSSSSGFSSINCGSVLDAFNVGQSIYKTVKVGYHIV